MSSREMREVKVLLRNYVQKSSAWVPPHYHPKIWYLYLPFNPYIQTEMIKTAHYFLQLAAVDHSDLVERTETTRVLIAQIYDALGQNGFQPDQHENVRRVIKEVDCFLRLGPNKDEIPNVIDSVNKFTYSVAGGDLIDFAKRFSHPGLLVEEIGRHIPYMNGLHTDHAWIYMRWMVRKYPDLHIFNNFSSKDLQVPLTSFVRNVGCCLGLCNGQPDGNNSQKIDYERKQLTSFAADLFPQDPAIADYPFYVLGRLIRGENPNLQLLKKYLDFWEKAYKKIQRAPIIFDLISREETNFEREVRGELERLQVTFEHHQYTFQLPPKAGAPTYKPDFVLHKCTRKGRTVILEPHGIWTGRVEKFYDIAGKKHSIWAYPPHTDPSEKKFVAKLRAFRATYKEMYYLILIVPTAVKERIAREYPDTFDELCDGRDLPKVLFDLKSKNT